MLACATGRTVGGVLLACGRGIPSRLRTRGVGGRGWGAFAKDRYRSEGGEMRSPRRVAASCAVLLLGSSIARADGTDANDLPSPLFSWSGMYLGYNLGVALG